MKFINLTPHAITAIRPDGTQETFPSHGVVRLESRKVAMGEIDGFPLFKEIFGEIQGVPEKIDRKAAYIVSALCKGALEEYFEDQFEDHESEGLPRVVSPGALVRDAEGKVVGCQGFSW